MTDTSSPAFQASIESMEDYASGRDIPPPANPLQAQTAFEKRARNEDFVAHTIAIIQTSGFFLLAFAALLGFVNISNAATATFLGTVMGYAVGKVDPILMRYFTSRSATTRRPPTTPGNNGGQPISSTPSTSTTQPAT